VLDIMSFKGVKSIVARRCVMTVNLLKLGVSTKVVSRES
jgi:hypothetical protein